MKTLLAVLATSAVASLSIAPPLPTQPWCDGGQQIPLACDTDDITTAQRRARVKLQTDLLDLRVILKCTGEQAAAVACLSLGPPGNDSVSIEVGPGVPNVESMCSSHFSLGPDVERVKSVCEGDDFKIEQTIKVLDRFTLAPTSSGPTSSPSSGPSGSPSTAPSSVPTAAPTCALFNGAQSVYLSDMDLDWASFANGWGPIELDTSNGPINSGDGFPLTLNGVVYPKGIGAHAPSSIVVPLEACSCMKFTAVVGVDDSQTGNIIFQVYLDGSLAYQSGVLLGQQGQTEVIDIDVTGASVMNLVIDPNGSNGNDHGDWAQASLDSC